MENGFIKFQNEHDENALPVYLPSEPTEEDNSYYKLTDVNVAESVVDLKQFENDDGQDSGIVGNQAPSNDDNEEAVIDVSRCEHTQTKLLFSEPPQYCFSEEAINTRLFSEPPVLLNRRRIDYIYF